MKSIKEQLKDIEDKIKILKDNNLENTTRYLSLINAKLLLREQLANELLKDKKE